MSNCGLTDESSYTILRKTEYFAEDCFIFWLTIGGACHTIQMNIRKTYNFADACPTGGRIMLKTRKECLQEYGSDYYIQQKIDAGELCRLEKGIFAEDAHVPELALISWKYPKAVVTMLSAFYYYGLTDTVPDRYDLATDRDAAKIADRRVRQFFMPTESFGLGITSAEENGWSFQIYDRERMLIELLRRKSKLSFDLYKEVLLNYRKLIPQLDIQKIQDYALAVPKSNVILNTLQTEVL